MSRRLRDDPEYNQDAYVDSCHEPCVYFLQSGGFIKIGHTNNIRKRLGNLQPGNPLTLELLGLIPADRGLERTLHRRFASAHYAGEWFYRAAEIVDFIASHRKDPV